MVGCRIPWSAPLPGAPPGSPRVWGSGAAAAIAKAESPVFSRPHTEETPQASRFPSPSTWRLWASCRSRTRLAIVASPGQEESAWVDGGCHGIDAAGQAKLEPGEQSGGTAPASWGYGNALSRPGGLQRQACCVPRSRGPRVTITWAGFLVPLPASSGSRRPLACGCVPPPLLPRSRGLVRPLCVSVFACLFLGPPSSIVTLS